MRRRRYLTAAGLTVAGLAGCTDDGSGGDGDGSGDGSGDGGSGGEDGTDGEGTTNTVAEGTTGTAANAEATTGTEGPAETDTQRDTTAGDDETTPTTVPSLGPAETVKTFLTAAGDGDIEQANALVHSESPAGEVREENQPEDIVVESTDVLSRGDGVAIVRTVVTVVTEDGERTYTVEYELRTENGAWRMWDARSSEEGGGSTGTPTGGSTGTTTAGQNAPPQVVWEFESRPPEDVVVATHNGGDVVVPEQIVARNVEETTFGTLDEFFDGEEIAAGDEVRVDVPADTQGTIQFVWQNPDGDGSTVLAENSYDVR